MMKVKLLLMLIFVYIAIEGLQAKDCKEIENKQSEYVNEANEENYTKDASHDYMRK